MPSVLVTHNLTKRFRGKTALEGLSITLEEGHIYALVGLNGAGKTTLMRLLAGLSSPSAGSLCIFGGESEENSGAPVEESASWWGSPSPLKTFPSGKTWSCVPA